MLIAGHDDLDTPEEAELTPGRTQRLLVAASHRKALYPTYDTASTANVYGAYDSVGSRSQTGH